MAIERNPNDPYRSNPADDPYRTPEDARHGERATDQLRNAARLDNQLQMDPELAEGPASGVKVAIFAVAIAVVLGGVFYGLNHSTINQAGTTSTAQNAPASPPPAPPGMRDVTPRANPNGAPGVTTGAAPAQPTQPQTPTTTANPPLDKGQSK